MKLAPARIPLLAPGSMGGFSTPCGAPLTAMQNRKMLDGFAFNALLNEDGTGHFELTKA
jgi:hypothetical protein